MSNLFSLENKTAIVTGGAKGIGESICRVFAQQGATVFLLDIDDENGQKAVDEINRESEGKVIFQHCDVSAHEETGAVFQQVYDHSGRLDILVNNAGIAHIGNVENTTEADLQRIFDINVKSVYNCLFFGVKHLAASGGGAIVNIGSVASLVGLNDRFAYSMSKGAVLSMTYSVAKDYLAANIRCNAVGPGRVHTPFVDSYLKNSYPGREQEFFEKLSKTQPIGRMGKPLEVAHLVLYLCSDEAAFITGSYYPIDGGFLTLNT